MYPVFEISQSFFTSSVEASIASCLVAGFTAFILVRVIAPLMARSTQDELESKQTLIAEYEPPQGLSAVEMGYLFDRKFGSNELLAVILTLANKQLLELGTLPGNNFSISVAPGKEKSYKNLDDAELNLIVCLRQDTNQTSWQSINSSLSGWAGPRADLETGVINDLVRKDVLERTSLDGLRQKVLIISALVAVVIALVPAWLTHPYANTENQFVQLDQQITYIAVFAFAIALWSPIYFYIRFLIHTYTVLAGRPLGLSSDASEYWPDIVGYRTFIEKTESHRLEVNPGLSDPSLPYCLALGLNTEVTLRSI